MRRLAAWFGITDPETPTRDELAGRVQDLEQRVDHLTALIEHPTWPEDYRRARATEAFNRLTDGGPRPRRENRDGA